MSDSQRRKNVTSLHAAAHKLGIYPILEVSTKSDERLGQRLSAFNLMVHGSSGSFHVENIFQGSKVFKDGGPYTDLYNISPRDAKSDHRIRESGPLLKFNYEGIDYPIVPETAFYDWIYIRSLIPYLDFLENTVFKYAGFTDIVFNPAKSIACQARSCALLTSLFHRQLLPRASESFDNFVELMFNFPVSSQKLYASVGAR